MGLSFTSLPRDVLIVTALIGIVVNAVNAATIRYTTEHYLDELDGHENVVQSNITFSLPWPNSQYT